TVRSQLPVASRFPSGEKATDKTAPECPLRVSSSWPAPASHSLTVRSTLPVASFFPSGEKATDQTPLLWRKADENLCERRHRQYHSKPRRSSSPECGRCASNSSSTRPRSAFSQACPARFICATYSNLRLACSCHTARLRCLTAIKARLAIIARITAAT